jgi:carbonic anhydrase
MCENCNNVVLKRRSILGLAGLGLAASAFPGPLRASETKASSHEEHAAETEKHDTHSEDGAAKHAAEEPAKDAHAADSHAEEAPDGLTPAQALKKLKNGNRAFVEDANACAANLAHRREELAGGQHPWAVILTCSDSRVTPELIFGGVTLGELFVIRNAGNVLDTGGLGTIEYGTEHLHAPLVVVMGHKKCGAVAAACDVVSKGTQLPASIGKMVQPILPVALNTLFKSDDFVNHTVKANAQSGADRIVKESPIVAELVDHGKVRVVSAVYDIESGEVEFFEEA